MRLFALTVAVLVATATLYVYPVYPWPVSSPAWNWPEFLAGVETVLFCWLAVPTGLAVGLVASDSLASFDFPGQQGPSEQRRCFLAALPVVLPAINEQLPDFVPQSQAFQDLVRKTKTHHPACGCGACCALSGWSVEDDERACQAERRY